MNKKDIFYLTSGIILIFLSIYLFTRPVIFSQFDLTATGQIGDTIGGISAPLINLIGAYLVYISFKTQLQANKIQIQALNDEKDRFNVDNIFQKQSAHFNDIKSTLNNLEFVVELFPVYDRTGKATYFAPLNFKGLNALNEFTNRLILKRNYTSQTYEVFGMLLHYQFMLMSIIELIDNVNKRVEDEADKIYLLKNIRLFYDSFLKPFAIKMEKNEINISEDISQIKNLINTIDEKYVA